MKIKIIFLNLFICGFFHFSLACDSLESLSSTFKIENNILITSSGEKYLQYPFESKLDFDLAFYMKDPKAAQTVYTAYKNHILPLIERGDDETLYLDPELFSRALIEICLLFGNPKSSPQEPLFHALRHQGSRGLKWIEAYSPEIRNFVLEANQSLYPIHHKKKSEIFRVAIITTTASGGNHSAAESMASYLKTYENIEPILIDFEDIAKEFDPIMIATHTYTYDMIYSLIFQRTNDPSVIPNRKKINRNIQKYIPNRSLMKLKEKIIDLHPDLIISTRSYTSDDIALSSLGIPFRLFHPDFELCPSLCAYYRSVPIDWIRFWIPLCRPSMFKPLFQKYARLDVYDEKDTYETVMKKVSGFLGVPITDFQPQFELIGYPCDKFFKINASLELDKSRKKWGIQEGEFPIFIMMGKYGTNAIEEIFDHLLTATTSLPLKYLFICGNNEKLRNKFKEKIFHSKCEQNRFIICDLLTPIEMNEIMNISSMGISKAGGATVIESLATNTPLLLMHSHPWEETNAAYLIEMGLAAPYNPKESLINQIENLILINLKNKEHNHLINWKENLISKIK